LSRGEWCRDQQAPFAFDAYGDSAAFVSEDYSEDRNYRYEVWGAKDSQVYSLAADDSTPFDVLRISGAARHEACFVVDSRVVSFRNAFVLRLYVIVPRISQKFKRKG
jgi:hypothetical protein